MFYEDGQGNSWRANAVLGGCKLVGAAEILENSAAEITEFNSIIEPFLLYEEL